MPSFCVAGKNSRIHCREVRGAGENGLSSTGRRDGGMLLYALRFFCDLMTTSFPSRGNFLHEFRELLRFCIEGITLMLAPMKMAFNVPTCRARAGSKPTPASRLSDGRNASGSDSVSREQKLWEARNESQIAPRAVYGATSKSLRCRTPAPR